MAHSTASPNSQTLETKNIPTSTHCSLKIEDTIPHAMEGGLVLLTFQGRVTVVKDLIELEGVLLDEVPDALV